MSDIPSCCTGCNELLGEEATCRLLAGRDLRAWVADRPCGVRERVRRLVRRRGVRGHDAEDLAQDVLVRLIACANDRANRIPAHPRQALRWCARLASNLHTDRARRKLPVGGAPARVRRECGTCTHRDRVTAACRLIVGTDPHTRAQSANPHFDEVLTYHQSPWSLQPRCTFYETRFQPGISMNSCEYLGIETAALSEVEAGLDAQLFLAHLGEVDPELPVVLGLMRAGCTHAQIGLELGCSERTVFRRVATIEAELRSFFHAEETC